MKLLLPGNPAKVLQVKAINKSNLVFAPNLAELGFYIKVSTGSEVADDHHKIGEIRIGAVAHAGYFKEGGISENACIDPAPVHHKPVLL